MSKNVEIKMGNLIPQPNKARKHVSEAETYYALKVEDENGKNERWLMLTVRDVAKLTEVFFDTEMCKKAGRIYAHHRTPHQSVGFVAINIPEGMPDAVIKIGRTEKTVKFTPGIHTYRITDTLISTWWKRALRNPEDIPAMGKLKDLFD